MVSPNADRARSLTWGEVKLRYVLAAVLVWATGCSGGQLSAPAVEVTPGECEAIDPVRLQLPWMIQARSAGYIAARDLGYYADYCLDVELVEGGPGISSTQRLAGGKVDFAVARLPSALVTRDRGANLVHVAQIFQRPGTVVVALTDSEITQPYQFIDRRTAAWGDGHGYEILAAASAVGLDPSTDLDRLDHTSDIDAFGYREYDVAAMSFYHEYAQLLERNNPLTTTRFAPSDIHRIDLGELDIRFLEDGLWADGDRLDSDVLYRDVAVRVIAASLRGWVECRNHPDTCVDLVLDANSVNGPGHQRWQMTQVNNLIWPSPHRIGHLETSEWDHTLDLMMSLVDTSGEPILAAAPSGATTDAFLHRAWDLLEGIDLAGNDYVPGEGVITPGGN